MEITLISDLHGYEPELEGGDLLIVAGDHTASDHPRQWIRFFEWLMHQNYRKKVLIAGNHDNQIEKGFVKFDPNSGIDYLQDSGCEFEGVKIWGTPWSLWFDGINPHCKAFTGSEHQLAAKYKLIPIDTDILVSHSPSWGMHDTLYRSGKRAGSTSLTNWIANHVNTLKLFVCGHIHEGYGEDLAIRIEECKMINCSYVNEKYQAVNKPIRVDLCKEKDGHVKVQIIKK